MSESKNGPAKSKPSHCALILPGAVARGAFEAGVIQVLAEQETRIDRIVATSSGALNGVAYAAGIRSGNEKEMAERLANAWIEKGGWYDSLRFRPLKWLLGGGLSDNSGIGKMLADVVKPARQSAKREVELRIIVTPLDGVRSAIAGRPATTYEKVIAFSGADFDTAEGLERIFKVTTAACAFPFLFEPVKLSGLGPCIDGGAVNNAPIAYALDECGVNRVIVPVPFPLVMPTAARCRGFCLLNHLIDILINERLFRDLKNAQIVNRDVGLIDDLMKEGSLSAEQAEQVKKALKMRAVEIAEVRPNHSLSGNPFSGFFSKGERARLVEEGRRATSESLFRVEGEGSKGPVSKLQRTKESNIHA